VLPLILLPQPKVLAFMSCVAKVNVFFLGKLHLKKQNKTKILPHAELSFAYRNSFYIHD